MSKAITAFLRKNLFQPHRYAILINPYYIARRSLFLAIKKFAQTNGSGKRILDVGCGNKPYQDLFIESQYTGIDIEGGGHVDEAKQVDRYFDGVQIPFPDNCFDMVICTQVLEHSTDPERLVKEMHRVLTPNGVLFVTVPFVWGEHEQPFDFRRYSSFGLRKVCEEGGFVAVRTQSTTGIFGTVAQLLSAYVFEGLGSNFISRVLVTLAACLPLQVIGILGDWLFRHSGITLDIIGIAKKL